MRTSHKALFAVVSLLLTSMAWSAEFEKGQEAYDLGDFESALAEWQPLADSGNADGQFGIGLLYANGFGVALDDDQALKWYSLAADQGHADAQCNIAIMYQNGWGVPQSDEEAVRWYSLAAENGVTAAQINLARMYFSGYGIEQNDVEAYKWFTIASELGDDSAGMKRDELAENMPAEDIADAISSANAWIDDHKNVLANR